jgi:hypothetical protein
MVAHYFSCSWPTTVGIVWFSHHHTACQLKWSFSHEGLMAVWYFFESEMFSFQTCLSRPQQTEYALPIAQWIQVLPPKTVIKILAKMYYNGVGSLVLATCGFLL